MNKKAQVDTGYSSAGNAIQAIVFLIFATASGGALAYTVNDAVANTITVSDATSTFLAIEAARNCFLYQENGRVYYQTIDPTKISDTNLEKCMPNKDVAVSLRKTNGEVIISAETGLMSRVSGTPPSFNVNIPGSTEIYKFTVSVSE